jgi:hypothetical protein
MRYASKEDLALPRRECVQISLIREEMSSRSPKIRHPQPSGAEEPQNHVKVILIQHR